jgi:anaerobic selenocysteine-containing dehydrogenase
MEFKTVLSFCPYCGCGCGLLLEVLDGKIVGTLPSKTSPVNQGKLCVKG